MGCFRPDGLFPTQPQIFGGTEDLSRLKAIAVAVSTTLALPKLKFWAWVIYDPCRLGRRYIFSGESSS